MQPESAVNMKYKCMRRGDQVYIEVFYMDKGARFLLRLKEIYPKTEFTSGCIVQ